MKVFFRRWAQIIERLIGVRGTVYDQEIWNKQYQRGTWDVLGSKENAGRYEKIVGLINMFSKGSKILDVGCGHGVVYKHIGDRFKKNYLGTDISDVAIKKAKKKHPGGRFMQADMVDYKTKEKFDVVIFNETLYYLEKPLKIVDKYMRFLAVDGILLVSMYLANLVAFTIWLRLIIKYKFIKIYIHRKNGKAWAVTVFRSNNSKA
jgi:2-polyprenyl-3-methyl-5-hydroxy-6-metoxy-1,4-benzoquinol methylase